MNRTESVAESQATNLSAAIAAAIQTNERRQRHRRAAVEATIELGGHLVTVKDGLKHGEYEVWLAANGIPSSSASNYVTLYRSGIESATVAELGGLTAAYRDARVIVGIVKRAAARIGSDEDGPSPDVEWVLRAERLFHPRMVDPIFDRWPAA